MAHRITEKCIGCTLCEKSCPVLAVSGTKKEQHTINPKRCIDCGVCGQSCPQEAILNAEGQVVEKLPKQDRRKPMVNQEACSACSMCVDGCRFECLTISMPAYKGDLRVYATLSKPKDCVGCGLCQRLCPLGAISLEVTK